jgi:membrane protein implicated in regulation of membrane protease activity
MSVLAALEGISPWWWVALAILLAAVEMVTVTTVVVWSALAAFVTALALWVAPGMDGAGQIALFASCSIAFTLAGRALVGRWGKQEEVGQLNRRAAQVIGRDAVVDRFEFGEGQVIVDGVPWPARLEEGAATPAVGARVRIVSVDGIVVRVRPL